MQDLRRTNWKERRWFQLQGNLDPNQDSVSRKSCPKILSTVTQSTCCRSHFWSCSRQWRTLDWRRHWAKRLTFGKSHKFLFRWSWSPWGPCCTRGHHRSLSARSSGICSGLHRRYSCPEKVKVTNAVIKTAFSLVLAWDHLKQYISVFVSLFDGAIQWTNLDVNELLERL